MKKLLYNLLFITLCVLSYGAHAKLKVSEYYQIYEAKRSGTITVEDNIANLSEIAYLRGMIDLLTILGSKEEADCLRENDIGTLVDNVMKNYKNRDMDGNSALSGPILGECLKSCKKDNLNVLIDLIQNNLKELQK